MEQHGSADTLETCFMEDIKKHYASKQFCWWIIWISDEESIITEDIKTGNTLFIVFFKAASCSY